MKGKEKLKKSQRKEKIKYKNMKPINKNKKDNNSHQKQIKMKEKLNCKDLEGNSELLKFKHNQQLKVSEEAEEQLQMLSLLT